MSIILDGKVARDFYKTQLTARVAALYAKKVLPRLAIIQIGNNHESSVYIEQKKKFAEAIGAKVDHIIFPDTISDVNIATKITELNADKNIHGIIIQLPIPAHLDRLALINLINQNKDVDGLTDESQRLLDLGTPHFVPATAKGVMALLDFYHIDIKAKTAVVFGRSRLVGHPIAELLKIRGAKVTVCHSKTVDAQTISRTADIVIVAIGKPRYINDSFIKPGSTVIDVGINVIKDEASRTPVQRKVVGDVDYNSISTIAGAISPVPGGIGPMTVLSLFDNLISSVE